MSELQTFDFHGNKIRALVKDGEFWFVAKDVLNVFGYENMSQVPLGCIDDECYKTWEFITSGEQGVATFVNEYGFYLLLSSSNLSWTKDIERWVRVVVYPILSGICEYKMPHNFEEALEEIEKQVELNEKLQLENKIKEQRICELQPKKDYCDIILQSDKLVTISDIAKDYGMSEDAMNKKLHELGVQYKQNNIWLLYREYQDKGYTQSQTAQFVHSDGTLGSKMHTKWTQKGRLFLYHLLFVNGVLPMIEREGTDE